MTVQRIGGLDAVRCDHWLISAAVSMGSGLAVAADVNVSAPPAVEPSRGPRETDESYLGEHELEPVVVTATRTDRAPLRLPGTSSVIDAEAMERGINGNFKDLTRYEPGVHVENDPQRFGVAGFNIRGIDGNRIQMLVDGVRMPDAFSIGTFQNARRNRVDLDSLKAVEIVRGPGSALYGSDGIGGVVSFVTKDPRDYLDLFGKSHFEALKVQYSSAASTFAQTATLAGGIGDWEGLLLGTHQTGSETDNQGRDHSDGRTRTAPNPQQSAAFNILGKVVYRLREDNALRLTGEISDNSVDTDVRHLYGLNFTGRNVSRFLTQDAQQRWRFSLDQSVVKIDWAWLDSCFWRVYGQESKTSQQAYEARTTADARSEFVRRWFHYDQSQVGGELQGRLERDIGSTHHRSVAGTEVLVTHITERRDGSLTDSTTGRVSTTVTPDDFPVRDFPLTTTKRLGLFIQDEISLWNKHIELLPALRFDYFSVSPEADTLYTKTNPDNPPIAQTFTAFSPKFGAMLHFNSHLRLHGQYAQGFRAPNFADVNSGFVNFNFGYASIANPNLKPETASSGEVGLRVENAIGYADATVYRNDYSGFIQNAVTCDPARVAVCPPFNVLTFQTINTPEDVRIQGFEFKGELRLHRIWERLAGTRLFGNFAYSEGRNIGTDKPVSSVNPMRGVLGIGFDSRVKDWGAEAVVTVAGPKHFADIDFDTAGNVFPTAGYVTWDLTAYYRFGDHVTLNAGLFNVMDKKYIDWVDVRSRGSDPHAGLGGPADISDRYTRPGRNVGLNLRVEF